MNLFMLAFKSHEHMQKIASKDSTGTKKRQEAPSKFIDSVNKINLEHEEVLKKLAKAEQDKIMTQKFIKSIPTPEAVRGLAPKGIKVKQSKQIK